MTEALSIEFSARLSMAATSIRAGYGVCLDTGANASRFKEATTAALAVRPLRGIAMSTCTNQNEAFIIRLSGWIDAAIVSGVGATGSRGLAVINPDGRIVRDQGEGYVRVGIYDEVGNVRFNPDADSAGGGGAADGKLVKAMANADQSIAELDDTRGAIEATGTLTARRNLTLFAPSSADDSRRRVVRNSTSGGYPVRLRTSSTSRAVDVPAGTTSYVEIDENGVREIIGGFYDPRDFGAMCDGETDDLGALDDMIDAMPSTGGDIRWPSSPVYIRDTWAINRPVNFYGKDGKQPNGMIEVAPGKSCIRIDSHGSPAAFNSMFSRLTLRSKQMVHPTANGSANGWGISAYFYPAVVRVGDLWVKSGGTDPTLCYRVTSVTANGGRGPAAMPSPAPSWSTTVGNNITDANGTVWTTERIPSLRANATAYAVGDRVFIAGDNRYILYCTVGGTSAGSPPAALVGGVSAQMLTIGGTVTDNTVTWRVDLAAGFWVRASWTDIEGCVMNGFTGAAIHIQGGAGTDTIGDQTADIGMVSNINFSYCGLGVALQGDDSNGWLVQRISGINVGVNLPTPTAGAAFTGATDPGVAGGGGHILFDSSQAGCACVGLYAQTSSGFPVLKRSTADSMFLGCYSENGKGYFTGGQSVILGGSLSPTEDSHTPVGRSASVLKLNVDGGIGFKESIVTTGTYTSLEAQLLRREVTATESGVLSMKAPCANDAINRIEWRHNSGYGPANTWILLHGINTPRVIAGITNSQVGIDPGPGWWFQRYGTLYGLLGTDTVTFSGHVAALNARELRAGKRIKGDRFWDGLDEIVVQESANSAGHPAYHAHIPYSSLSGSVTSDHVDYTQESFSGFRVEPTATWGQIGSKVFKITGSGAFAAEPSWAGAVNPGDTVVTGGITFTLVGFRPPCSRMSWNTTNNTTLTLWDKYLSTETLTEIEAWVEAWEFGAPDAARFHIRGSWYRDGSAAAVAVEAPAVISNTNNAVGAAWTAVLNLSTNNVRVRVTGDTGKTIRWTVRSVVREALAA